MDMLSEIASEGKKTARKLVDATKCYKRALE